MTIEDIIRKIVREEIQEALSEIKPNKLDEGYPLLKAGDIAEILQCSKRVA